MRAKGLLCLSLLTSTWGCNRTPDAISLLKAGNASVCADSEVQKTLSSMLMPEKTGSLDNDRLVDGVSFSYDTTTLEKFDKDVFKATCNTQVVVKVADNTSDKQSLTFIVSPSAEDAALFVIETLPNTVTARASGMIEAEKVAIASRAQEAQNEEEQAARKARVMAVLNRRWLTGIWREYSPNWGGDFSCETDAYSHVEFEPSGRFGTSDESGTFRLNDNVLNINAAKVSEDGSTQPASSYSLTAYDVNPRDNTITLQADSGSTTTYRRCPKPRPVPPPVPEVAPGSLEPSMDDNMMMQ